MGRIATNVPAGGVDLEMPGPARWMAVEKIVTAVANGSLDPAIIDDKVRRLLQLIERVTQPRPDFTPAGSELPRQVATEAIVLLKNEGDLLPLNPDKQQTIAVIGENAAWAQIMGGGSSQVNPHYIVSPLEGIRQRVGEAGTVAYQIGTPIHRLPPLANLDWLTAANGQAGLSLDYFHNLTLSGEPAHRGMMQKTDLTWFGTANPLVDPANFSLRLYGLLTPPESGAYQFHLWSIGQARLSIDGQVVIDHWGAAESLKESDRQTTTAVTLTANQPVNIEIEYITEPEGKWRTVRLGCVPPMPADPIQAAVDLAGQADVAIVVAGLTREWESEGFDRADMRLVGAQDELIARVAAANPNTIVVLNVGSPVEMPWVNAVPAIVQSWYGGQEAGNALADVLFGDVNPSGKLPTTFPVRLEDNPAFINYPGENGQVHYGEGLFVGYRYYDKKQIAPLFPFGHGLSYTQFAYANLRLNGERFTTGDEILVQVEVTNTGARAGQEVVQLYVRDEVCRVARPWQELKAFAKVQLAPGETKTVTLPSASNRWPITSRLSTAGMRKRVNLWLPWAVPRGIFA
jgi:beta-glucosidase